MPIGTLIGHVLASLPSNWLDCDGATYNRVDWPELYAVLDSAYILDADHFKTPDLKGRTPIGVGAGSGLTSRAVDATGGEENHVLTVAELAQHNHSYNNPAVQSYPYGTFASNAFVTINTANTANAGSNTAHNTMQPFTAVKFAIVGR
jgi:microcystin-dependent protein